MLRRHVAYIPRPDYEQLSTSGLLRYPFLVRTSVRICVPKELLAWIPFLAAAKMRAVIPQLTSN